MLHKVKTLKDYKLDSIDGDIGKVRELLFDDRHWTVRYLVADTGGWLTGQQVLLSPYSLRSVNDTLKSVAVGLTRKQIENSPALATNLPVSRQFEDDYNGYYGWPEYYWGAGAYSWGPTPFVIREKAKLEKVKPGEKAWDHHLRSTNEVSTYSIKARNGEIGHVEDFIIDSDTWAVRYLVVSTRSLWPGKKVLVAPQWIERVSWSEKEVFLNLSREEIRLSPEFTDDSLVTRDYETSLHGHYNRHGYWVDEMLA